MTVTLILHVSNEEPIHGEVDDIPKVTDTMICLNNPRRADGKDLHYLAESVTTVYWPVSKINFIEVLPSKEEEEIFGFVRE